MSVAEMPTTLKLLTDEQATEILGLTDGTLAKWRCTKRHDLPYVRVGRAIRYRLADLERFISENTVGTAAE